MNRSLKRILIVTRHTPLPWEDGAGAYLHDLARFLSRSGARVDVLWLKPHEHLRWKKAWRLPSAFDASVRLHLPGTVSLGRWFFFPATIWLPFKARMLHRSRRVWRAMSRARTLPPATPAIRSPAGLSWSAIATNPELAIVQQFAAKRDPDVVIASYAWMCPIFGLPALRAAKHVCLTHDVAWKRVAFSTRQKGPGAVPEFTRETEAGLLQRAGILIAISQSDVDDLRELAPTARVLFTPMACERHASAASPGERRLLFVGSGNSFNAEGINWFLSEVWPSLRQQSPDIELDVVGAIATVVTARPTGTQFHGRVPDLAPFYQRASVVIVPLLRATGLNIKLVEAAAFGRAIVATPVSLAGAPFLGPAVASAVNPVDFARAVLRFLDQPAERIAAEARTAEAVRTHLQPATCYGPLAAELIG